MMRAEARGGVRLGVGVIDSRRTTVGQAYLRLAIHNATSSIHADICIWSRAAAASEQEP